jgi:phosphoserine aminotransferase
MKKINFFSGPAIIPNSVLVKASESVIHIDDLGLSILEISHRSPTFQHIMSQARLLVRQLLGVPSTHEVLFLHGGASAQFYMVPMNLLKPESTATYTDTGQWAAYAIKEARKFGHTHIACSSAQNGYRNIPITLDIPTDSAYLHLTSNNTIYGTQWKAFPKSPVPIICDMSSDIFSRSIDVSQFDIIYAGAQKNLGPAGTTIVIVRKDILGKTGRDIPTLLDYQTHIDHDSMFNTPPVFAIYVCYLTLQWLVEQGGVSAMEQRNKEKAALLYAALDANPAFIPYADKEDRSLMNVTFHAANDAISTRFLDSCADAGIIGIEGYRKLGGFRASIYNAMDIEGVKVLAEVIASVKG